MHSEIKNKLDEQLYLYNARFGCFPDIINVSYETFMQLHTLLSLWYGKESYQGIEVKLDRPYEKKEMRFDFVKEEINYESERILTNIE